MCYTLIVCNTIANLSMMVVTLRTECCNVRALLARSIASSVAASGVQQCPTGESDLCDRAIKSTLDICLHDINPYEM